MTKVSEKFDAFICGINFSFGGTTGSECLATRGPVDGSIHPDKEAREGTGFEEFNWRIVGFGLGLVLRTPVGVGKGGNFVTWNGELDEGVESTVFATVVGDTEVFGADEIFDNVFGGGKVTFGGFVVILC